MNAHYFFCRWYRNIRHTAILSSLPILIALFTAPCFRLDAQAVISTSASATPHASAMLDIQSPSPAKGLLIPRMTSTERAAILLPAKGLLVFDNTLSKFYFYTGSAWAEVGSAGAPLWTASGANIYTTAGRVGIGTGTGTPLAPLHVAGSVSSATEAFAFYAKSGSCAVSTGGGCLSTAGYPTIEVSIYATNHIRASQFDAASDARIKRITGRSDPAADLATLNRLHVTDYQHIDVVNNGAAVKKGFIAQEVEQVFPEAVSLNRDFVPDCYRMAGAVCFDAAARSLTLTLDAPCTFVPGDRVRLIGSQSHELTVTAVAENAFTVSDWPEPEAAQVFVFGKQVGDFRTVDYDRIFTLGVSAMQELAKENDALKTRLEQLASENCAMRADVETLKTAVFGMAKK